MKVSKNFIQILSISLAIIGMLLSCEPSYNEMKRMSREERARLQHEDSAALKVGVLPTLDCLPLYLAKEHALFDTARADIRLKQFKAQIDCDEALQKGRIEGNVTDLVRALYMKSKGFELNLATSTNSYWQLISNRKMRIKEIKQLQDKMIAITRFSATALLADFAVDSVKLKQEDVFRIQINDVNLRLQMLLNNEMDAALLPEPCATTARMYKNPVLMDSKDKDMRFGVIVFNSKTMKDKNRKVQLDVFTNGYNAACDSLNKFGLIHYADIIKKYCHTDDKTIAAMPKIRFNHVEAPRQKDIDRASKWLK